MMFLLLISGSAIAAYKKDISARFIQHSNFIEIKKGIYISPTSTEEQKTQFLELVRNAKNRIVNTYGEFTASPIIIVCHNAKQREKFSTNSFASAKLLPFSDNKAYIVVGEKGHNLDIVAHELMHAEVFHRIGYYNQLVKIPVWFNEGVAMQVDHREKYNKSAKLGKKLNQLKYGWQFFRGDQAANYSEAKRELKVWFSYYDYKKLYRMLDAIKNGSDFNKLYFTRIDKVNKRLR